MARILVVDDRLSNRQFILTLLGYAGHGLLEAENGVEALRVVSSNRPDLIITDILMPRMDGFELCSRLLAEPDSARIPVIFYTASYSEAQAQRLAAACNVCKVLPKPCDPEIILSAVSEALTLAAPAAPPAKAAQRAASNTDIVRSVDRTLEVYLRDLQGVKVVFDGIVRHAATRPIDRPRIRDLSLRFSENVAQLQRITARLSGLLEVGLAMNSERDPQRLFRIFFAAACEMIECRIAAAGLREQEGAPVTLLCTRGVEEAVLSGGPGQQGMFARLLGQRQSIRSEHVEDDTLPAAHPPIRTLLALTIASSDHIYGWIYFADRTGPAAFSAEDEQLAGIMATQLALRYEHALLYQGVQSQADALRREVAERRNAQSVLQESEGRFRQLAENIHEVFWLTDVSKQQMLYVSPAYEQIWGRTLQSLYSAPHDWIHAIHPLDRQRVQQLTGRQIQPGAYDEEYRIVRPDGSVRWIRDRAFPVRDATGEITRIAGVAEDITERRSQEQKIARLTRMYAVLSGINAMIVRVREPSELFRECCRIIVESGGLAAAHVCVLNPATQILDIAAAAGADRTPERTAQHPALARALRERTSIVDRSAEGSSRSLAALPLMPGGEPAGVLALESDDGDPFDEEEMRLLHELAGDVSFALEHIRRAETLRYLALYDPLTGLANRTLFLDRLAQRLHLAARSGETFALALTDIDRLRTINASLGRQAGDALIRQLSERLMARFPHDALARIGGDQFVIVLESEKDGSTVAQEVDLLWQHCFAEPFRHGDAALTILGKCGVVQFPEDGNDSEILLRNAEAALRRAKDTGDRHVFHTADMLESSAASLSLENGLRLALKQHEFRLHYQPVFDLETRRIVGAEALLRWQSPDRGLVMPGEFMALLEETGLILEVGQWVLHQALQDQRRWASAVGTPPRVAVNVSSIQLRQRDFIQVVRTALQGEQSAPALDLEITESATLHDIAEIAVTLRALRDAGIRVEIDDFGTGYSSLSYLTRLPVHALKIDRTFIASMLGDPSAMTLVSTIISLAHSMRMCVIAEGVETEEQAHLLRLLRCDQVQGYLFGRPMPVTDLLALLTRGAASPATR